VGESWLSGLGGVLGVAMTVALAAAVVIYNGFVRLANACDRAWSNIDVLLKQRYDEIPNLVAVCRGYMEYERDALTRVTEARNAGLTALERARSDANDAGGDVGGGGRRAGREGRSSSERVEADRAAFLAAVALGDLFALAEAYPKLKANEQFLGLQRRITGLESEIADRREHFNQCVTNYNVRREQIPDVVVARLLGLSRRTLLRVPAAERQPPRVFAAVSTEP
jgi:LemA protein